MAIRRWINRPKGPAFYRQLIGLLVIAVLLYGIGTPLFKVITLPPQYKVSIGEPLQLSLGLPQALQKQLSVRVRSLTGSEQLLTFRQNPGGRSIGFLGLPLADKPGTVNLEMRLFGIVPLKKMVVTVASPVYVVPGGQSIGVYLRNQGVSVVDSAPIRTETGREFSPGEEAGIQMGDIICQANDQEIIDEFNLAKVVDTAGKEGKSVRLVIERGRERLEVFIQPVFCPSTNRYRIGLLVKDGSAGVGTLSFYHPDSGVYGALGHVIVDPQSNQELEINDGRIVMASIKSVQPGRKGQPGEKLGVLEGQKTIGTINKNGRYGIYGNLAGNLPPSLKGETIPVAWQSQVYEGPATMLTVVKDNEIESFTVQVEKIMPNRSDGKGMVIRVTDPRLLQITGGIIQGMSGSPLIQDGRLIGAVTHVFVNDPTKGYALLAEYMLSEIFQLPRNISSVRSFTSGRSFFIQAKI